MSLASSVASPAVVNIADLRRAAMRRLPRPVFDYVDGGADAEATLRANVTVFDEVLFRPRGAVASPRASLETTVLGQRLSLPFLLAPVGSTRLLFPKGEIEAARAAGAAGAGYILSTLAGTSLEEVKAGTTGVCWYQVYLVGGREVASAAIERARKAGYTALVLTVDTAISGLRERDYRNGIAQLVSANPFRKLPYLWQILSCPGWLLGYLADGGLMQFPNVVLPGGPMRYAAVAAALEQSVVSWADLRWIREIWKGPILIKGVLTAEDAERAVDAGAAAVIVSNHGGRQLDGVFPTLRALPEVVEAVRGRAEVLMDGGIRRGSDIVKALLLGARAVLVGRAYAYGLGAAGAAGVTRAIEILTADLHRTLRLLGCASLADLDPSMVELPVDFGRGRRRLSAVAGGPARITGET
ncbi:MAG TPA: alpha-hydroxy acid oxidase [Myxococcaceae bacterium]|nr:alpha-hydroxy acid oxidase [Myxococcaceae bacterium]